jgi:hypothetical protein
MRTRRKALSSKNVPRRLHLMMYAVIWLLMDRFNPPGWAWGVVGTICAVMLMASLVDFFGAEDVELP